MPDETSQGEIRPGRPCLDSPRAPTVRLTLTIPAATAQWLRDRAAQRGTSMATEAREALSLLMATESG